MDLPCAGVTWVTWANFSIKQFEAGYEVYTAGRALPTLLGTATILQEAGRFVPDSGHELLYDVHGIRLSAAVRHAILTTGFPVWG